MSIRSKFKLRKQRKKEKVKIKLKNRLESPNAEYIKSLSFREKFNSFGFFLGLIVFWSVIFGSFKFYFWSALESSGFDFSLAKITFYLSVGSIASYLIGGALSYAYKEKHIMFFCGLLSILFMYSYYLFDVNAIIMAGIILGVGFFYGIWTVVKNVLIGIEIEKTGLQDTTVNAIASILFIVALIGGSIGGSWFFEVMGNEGLKVIMIMVGITMFLAIGLEYKSLKIKKDDQTVTEYVLDRHDKFIGSLKAYLPSIWFLIGHYKTLIIGSSIIWAVSTALSQQAMEYAKDVLGMSGSEAGMVLFYSAVGAIIGNFLTMRLAAWRWGAFRVINFCFGLLVFCFPFLLGDYNSVIILAVVSGVLFGGSSNLIDSYFFHKIAIEDRKEYGSATYGFVLSIVIAGLMFFVSLIQKYANLDAVFYFMGIVIVCINLLVIMNLKKLQAKQEISS